FRGRGHNIPFKDNTFNLVIMLEVIEHIPILLSALNEITRVLKNDGKLIIVDRNKFSFNNRRFLVPNLLVKRYHEIKNEWMYPNDFPYRERWFNPYAIHKILKEYFKDSEYEYVLSDGERQRWWHAIFRAIPQIRHFVLWHSTNKYSKNSG
ncbi:MAG: class I SAM-dependent methyltransferase, partial [Candidatus Orphnella occulta]|nr:class I SAM-dependent methyltransferase [Candidatus Orphnella occulta]